MLTHLLSASYLYAIDELPLGRWPRGAGWWAGLLLILLAQSLWQATHDEPKRPLALAGSVSSGLGLLWLAARPWLAGPVTARIWPLSATALAIALLLLALTWPRLGSFGTPGLCAMALRLSPADNGYTSRRAWMVAAGHAAGLATVGWRTPDIAWLAALSLGALVCVWLVERLRASRPSPPLRLELLAPLGLCYGTLLLRWTVGGMLGVDTAPYAAFPYPDPWSIWFNPETMAIAASAWVIVASIAYLTYERKARLAAVPPALALGWYVATLAKHISQGATGSDPYCYLQMASDLAHHGTALHAFPLLDRIAALGLPTWPALHVGYQLPATGSLAPTVWPIGWSVMLMPLVWLGGERLAMWGAPLCQALTAMATWQLARNLWPDGRRTDRNLIASLASALVITSTEAMLRSLLPMADAAAMLWTTLFLLSLVRAQRTSHFGWDMLAGVALGMAYWVRHPLLLLGAGATIGYLPALRSKRGWLRACVLGGAAAIVAMPDLAYHARWWGSPWHTESPEWFLISIANIPHSLTAMLRDGFLRRNELGFLWPFILISTGKGLRSRRSSMAVWAMALSLGGVLLFALCYEALRWRDLLALVPALSILAAAGMVRFVRSTNRSSMGRAAAIGLCLLALAARATPTYRLPTAERVWTFGHVAERQRQAFGELALRVPDDAIIATGLNSGAVERTTGNMTVRPSSWSIEQFQLFADDLATDDRLLYILDDGEEMHVWLENHSDRLSLTHIDDLALSTMGLGGQPLEQPARLYLVKSDTLNLPTK